MKRPDGVTIISIVNFFVGALALLGVCFWLALVPAVIASDGSGDGRLVGSMFMVIFALGTLLVGVLPIVAGWGLLKLKEWARWLTIVFAIFLLFGFPVGTAIGALIIWYLLKPEVAMAFGSGMPVVPQPMGLAASPVATVPPSPAPWSGPAAQPPAPNYPPQSAPSAPNYPPQTPPTDR